MAQSRCTRTRSPVARGSDGLESAARTGQRLLADDDRRQLMSLGRAAQAPIGLDPGDELVDPGEPGRVALGDGVRVVRELYRLGGLDAPGPVGAGEHALAVGVVGDERVARPEETSRSRSPGRSVTINRAWASVRRIKDSM